LHLGQFGKSFIVSPGVKIRWHYSTTKDEEIKMHGLAMAIKFEQSKKQAEKLLIHKIW